MSTSHTLENIDIVKGLAEQWKLGKLCDVKLSVQGQKISAHKNVLAAASPYFCRMFLGEFKESKYNEVNIQGISHTALHSILSAIYTKQLILNNEVVEEVLFGSDFLQMDEISKKCEQHMIHKLTDVTYFQFLRLCETFNLEEGRKICDNFIIKHFSTVCQNQEFLEIAKDALCSYLNNDTLGINNELEAFNAARSWIEHDKKRSQHASEILHTVRFASIPLENLKGDIPTIPFIRQDEGCMQLLSQTLNYLNNVHTQPMYNGSVNKPRGKPSLVVIESGEQTEGENYNCFHAVDNHFTEMWHVNIDDLWLQPTVKKIPVAFAYSSVSVVSYGNFLFLFGVETTQFCPVSMRFDATMDKWIDLMPMPDQAKVYSSVVRLGNVIVIAGGMYIDKDTYSDVYDYDRITKKVHLYHIATNSWTRGKDLPKALAQAGSCEFKGEMYMAGGILDHRKEPQIFSHSTEEVWAYNLNANIWVAKTPLHLSDWDLCLASLNNRLYAFGGANSQVAILSDSGEEWKGKDCFVLSDLGQTICSSHDDTIFIMDHLGPPEPNSQLSVWQPDGDIEFRDIERCGRPLGRHGVTVEACALLTLK